MSNAIQAFFAIILCLLLVVISPVIITAEIGQAALERNAANLVEEAVMTFSDTGVITQDSYYNLIEDLTALGVAWNVRVTHEVRLAYPAGVIHVTSSVSDSTLANPVPSTIIMSRGDRVIVEIEQTTQSGSQRIVQAFTKMSRVCKTRLGGMVRG